MRGPRILVKDSYYHVCARINRGEYIFNDNEIKKMYEDVLKQAKTKFKYILRNFIIMTNHVHLQIKPLADECLSDIMKWIQQTFACRYNKKFGLTGHVWGDRFYSVVISSIMAVVNVFYYISQNPVRSALVDTPEEYKFGGYYHIKNKIFDIVDPPDDIQEYLF